MPAESRASDWQHGLAKCFLPQLATRSDDVGHLRLIFNLMDIPCLKSTANTRVFLVLPLVSPVELIAHLRQESIRVDQPATRDRNRDQEQGLPDPGPPITKNKRYTPGRTVPYCIVLCKTSSTRGSSNSCSDLSTLAAAASVPDSGPHRTAL